MHSAAVQALLQQYGDLLGQDLATHHVYGSASRPMSAAWARIPDAVYMQADRQTTGYHTYVAVPGPLSQEIINSYELSLVSPEIKTAKLVRAIAIELACPECGETCRNLQNDSYMIEEEHEIVECENCKKQFKTPAAPFKRR